MHPLLRPVGGSHWDTEVVKQVPCGTPKTATQKLNVAAHLYGTQQVGKHTAEFTTHEMIEIHFIYLLKSQSIKVAKPLDEYCALLPYDESLRMFAAASDLIKA